MLVRSERYRDDRTDDVDRPGPEVITSQESDDAESPGNQRDEWWALAAGEPAGRRREQPGGGPDPNARALGSHCDGDCAGVLWRPRELVGLFQRVGCRGRHSALRGLIDVSSQGSHMGPTGRL